MTDVPVLVAGGSLAGMAAAIRLRQRGVEVMVVEKDVFPRPKLCGEFLSPDAFAPLMQLGVFDAVRAEATGPIERVHFYTPDGHPLTVSMHWMSAEHPYGLALPRARLDDLLMQMGKHLGIAVWEGYRVLTPVRRKGEGLTVRLQSRNGEKTIHTRALVDATGRHGGLSLEDRPATARRHAKHVGLQCHVQLDKTVDTVDLHMFLFEGGYGGLQPLNRAEANLCMLAPVALAQRLHAGLAAILADSLGSNPAARRMLEGAQPLTAWHTTANLNLDLEPAAWSGLIRTGDALVTVDPFSGSGMAHALQSGLLAADCIAKGLLAHAPYQDIYQHYKTHYVQQFGPRLGRLRRFRPVLYNRPLQRFWPVLKPALPWLTRALR